jgi:hypothetical protein
MSFPLSKVIAPEMVIHAAKESNLVVVNKVDDADSSLYRYELAYYEQLDLLNFIFKLGMLCQQFISQK